MRLLLVTQDFPPRVGGIQMYCLELARRFAERCEAFAVVAPRVSGAAATDRALAFPVHRVASPPSWLPVLGGRVLRRLLRTGRFDAVLHAQWTTAGAALASRDRGRVRRVFVAAHAREVLLEPFRGLPVAHRRFVRSRARILREADLLFPVSRYTARLLVEAGAPAGRVRVTYNGVDERRYAPGSGERVRARLGLGDRPVILSVARLYARKGTDLLLRALPEVRRSIPEAACLIAGDGPLRAEMEALAGALGLTGTVHFLGEIPFDEIPEYYRACDVFAMAPRTVPPDVEGFGLVYLEANAAGKPVVASRSGGVPDAVVDGQTGLLVDEDDVPALARALIRLLADPELAARLGRRGRERVLREMTWDHVADRILEAMRASLATG